MVVHTIRRMIFQRKRKTSKIARLRITSLYSERTCTTSQNQLLTVTPPLYPGTVIVIEWHR